MAADRDEVLSAFQRCVGEVLDVAPDTVRLDARWADDLGADSLDVIEISLALNEAFTIKLPDVEPAELVTVGQAFELVLACLDR